MDVLELRNFLQGEGEELNEVAAPTIDITETTLIDICDAIESDGLDNLIKNLGTISNTFKSENEYSCSPYVLAEGVKLIHAALERLHMEITAAQGNTKNTLQNIDRPTKLKFRKYMAVLYFLVNQSFVEIERAVTAEAHNISIQMASNSTGRRGKGKKQTDAIEESKYQFWLHWRPKIIQRLWKVIAPPMHEIWDGGIEGGYNFLRLITLALCTTIKNKAKRLRNSDDEVEDIFDILGILASKHQEQKGIMARLIPLLKGSEEAATIIASGIDRMIKLSPDQAQHIVLHALSETIDTYLARFDKESGQERGFHAFLTNLCVLQPRGAMHSLPVIVQFLESESQIVRNAVLVVAHELMNWSWSEIQEEENSQNSEDQGERVNSRDNWLPLRRKLLDEILLLHLRDTNSFVRTKAIHLLADLVKKKTTVPEESVEIMKNVRLRLLDKTVTARKAATSLVVDMVNEHPYIVSPAEDYMKKRENKIQSILDIIQHDETNPAKALYFIIKEFTLHSRADSFIISPQVKGQVTSPEAALKLLEKYLKEGKYWNACETMYLSIKKWTAQLEQALLSMKQNDNDSEEELYLRFFKSIHPDVFPQNVNDLDLNEVNYIAPTKVIDHRDFIKYLQCGLQMQTELEKCQPSLRKLLELGTTADKKEAVMFFSAICEAGYKPSQSITISIINALSQLGPEELPDFVEPFRNIFIGRENFGPVMTARKIIQLVHKLSESLVESLGGMIGELYRSNVLTSESIKVLWDAFGLHSTGGWDENESRSAAYILGILGKIERALITTNLQRLIDVGLGERGLNDSELAKVTLQTILYGCRVEESPEIEVPTTGKGRKVPKATSKNTKASEGIKFPPSNELFTKIVTLIEHGLQEEGNQSTDFHYSKVVELAIQIIYRMCTEPQEVVMRFLPNVHGFVFAASSSSSTQALSQNQIASQDHEVDPFKLSEKILFRYMSFGKALLGAHITYYEQVVSKEIKARKVILDKSKKKKKTNGRERGSRLSNISSASMSSAMNSSNGDAASEMDVMIGNIGFDAEADNIKTYVAKLLDTGFFRNFRVHVLYLCQVFGTVKSLNLKISVVQALAKLMLICEQSVQKHIQYLLNLWSGDEDFSVKLEILKASIRLTVKFPNQMEKMNDGFSSGLAHPDCRVRKACMDYIQYLALSDLLKVREQLSDCAACLCDESFELREMAKDFISQIAEKDNVLQNSIPDIISRLSTREDITQENFQIIMKTLLTKIKKEKQLGGLVERIVGRFKGIVSVRVCQDTAYCLTQIQHNDKTLKILKDNFHLYADKLGDDDVWQFFGQIQETFRKMNKQELKLKLDEWEKDLEENYAKCVALNDAAKVAKRKNDRPKLVKESELTSDEEEEEQEAEERDNDNQEEQNEEEEAENNGNGNDEEMEGSSEEDESESPQNIPESDDDESMEQSPSQSGSDED